MSEIQSNGREKIVFPKSLKAGKEITELTTVKKATLTSTEKFSKNENVYKHISSHLTEN